MTLSRTTTHTTTFLAALVAATIVLSGCATTIGAAPSPSASASDEATATSTAGATVTATGATGWPGLDFPVPAGARSVSIDFTCEGVGPYVVEFGDAMAENTSPISGTCGAPSSLAWPVDAKTQPSIAVTVDDSVAWTATPLFSTTEFVRDAAVTADCAAFVDIYSALMNADQGYSQYKAFDAATWTTRVAAASSQLAALAAASTSSLKGPLTSMSHTVSTATEPGTAQAGIADEVAQIGAACNANQTPYFIKAEFGG